MSKYCCPLTKQCGNFGSSQDGCEWVSIDYNIIRLDSCPFPESVVLNHVRMYDEYGRMV